MYIAVKQVINVSGSVDDSGLLVTWERQPGSGYNYEVCYTDLSTTTQMCENVTDAGSHTFISATGTAVYQVRVKAFGGQMSAPASITVQISELQNAFKPWHVRSHSFLCAIFHLKNAEWTIMSAQWITAVYHVWEMDVIVMVIQTVQTMKMRPNAVS